MKLHSKLRPVPAAQLLLMAVVLGGLPPVILAQDEPAPAPAAPSDAVQLEKVEVTGSRIKRIDVEGPTPISVITRDQIEKLGYTTVREVLGNLTYNAGGSFDAGQSFSFAKGSQSVDLRGFGAGRTLVLLDGRRLPVFPQGLGGTDAFVDLSTIPASLIERVEVLLDGASAIYGSDAISGVINIITRKDITGSELHTRFSGTEDGGGSAHRFQFLQGFTAGDTSVQFIGEYTKQNVLKFTDRDFSESDYANGGRGSGFGNSFADGDGIPILAAPGCGTAGDGIGGLGVPQDETTCRFDRSKYRQFIPDAEKGSLYLRADRKIGDVNTFIRVGHYRGKQTFELEPNAFSGGESFAFTSNRIIPIGAFDPTFGPGYVAAGAVNNPTTGTDNEQGGYFFRRLVEFGPRGSELTTLSYNGLLGVSGTFNAFSNAYTWEAGLAHNEVRLTAKTPTILSSVFDNEVSNNGLNLFQPIPQDVLTRSRHTQFEEGVSRNTAIDATVTGPIGLTLPGGAAQFALSGIYNDESYKDEFDAISTAGDVFDGGNGGAGDRKYTGVGLEFSFPILESFELGVAGRVDSYDDKSDVGSAFSPSVRAGYRPVSEILIRASYGESFRAPDLQRLFGASSNGFETVFDTPTCTAAGGTPGTAIDPNNANDPCLEVQSVPSRTGSNVELKEEKGKNFNVGFQIEPAKDLNFKVDYYKIKVDDIVDTLTAQQLLDTCASSGAFCDQITRDPITGLLGTPTAGGSNAALISATAVNLATQQVKGIDTGVSFRYRPSGLGQISHEFSWSHIISLKVRSLADGPLVEQIGFGQTILAPEDRYSLTTDWDFERYGMTLRIDRVGKYPGSNSLTEPATSAQFVDSYTTVNLQARVDFGKLGALGIGVENLLDEDFPLDPTFAPGTPNVQNQFLGEGTSYFADPRQRRGYVTYSVRF